MLSKRLIKSNNAGAGACTNTVDLYNPFPDGGGVALYQLNGDATDVSGNYNGTATNVTYGSGQFGQAGVFNGSTSQVSFNNTGFPSTDMTVSAWIKPSATFLANGLSGVVAWGNSASGQRRSLVYYQSGQIGYSGYFAASNFTGTTVLPTEQWSHISFTLSGGTVTLYINGSFEGSGTVAVNAYSSTTAYIGTTEVTGTNEHFNGSIDQVRVFNRVLRPYEVEALYTEEYCTPTIVPSEHFNTVLYTGNGGTQNITGVGFQPDLVFIKVRTNSFSPTWSDSVRGADKALISDGTNTEYTDATFSIASDGFNMSSTGVMARNASGNNYVSWNWKAGGSAVTNTDGTITSQVSANTEAGFSVVSYTTQSSGTATVGHGLNTEPNIVLVKTTGVADSWRMYHSSLGAGYQIYLNLTNAAGVTANQWNNTAPTSSVFSLGTDNAGSYTTIAYCFAQVEGFSSFGSYVGTGTTEGQLVVTGFEPAFVMWKKTSNATSAHWNIVDNKRSPLKDKNNVLYSNLSSAEDVTSYDIIDFNANGFQVKASNIQFNESGATFIYMAFAADPTAVEPTLEDSFNTVLYTGNGSATQEITGVGFQPDFTWTKSRSNPEQHGLFDSVRGANLWLNSGGTEAETNYGGNFGLLSWSNNGFTVGNGSAINQSGYTYVAWNWKGAEIPAINSNGSIPSVVSANPAAGFSIVSYTGNGSVGSVGHGLGQIPNIIIAKNRDGTNSWVVRSSELGNGYLQLESSVAYSTTTLWGTPDDSVFSFTSNANGLINNNKYIAYCFAEVAGFSKFGSYTGTGGVLSEQTLGFEPAFIMFKRTDSTGDWFIYDNKRDTTDPRTVGLYANLSAAEYNTSGSPGYADINFLSNGFSMNANYVGINGSGGTFIYMAFANQF